MYKTLIVSNMNIARSPSFISKTEGCIQAWSACKNANGIIMLRSSSLKLEGIPKSQQLTYVNKQLIVPQREASGDERIELPQEAISYVLPPEEYELGLCGIDKGWASLIAGWQKIGYKVRVFSDASIVKPATRELLAKQKRTFCSYKTIYR